MATKVSIKNFQSIKDVNFTIDGFTVIVGKNNIGKSAIIRAIDNALKNEVGNEYIRKGTKESEVTITRDDIQIKWTKGASAVYEITPTGGEKQVHSKLNRDVPQAILDAGFEKIQIEDKLVSPLIAHQFEPLFLLNKRGSVVTEVLTALYDMDLISIADDRCQKDLKAQKSSCKVRELDLKNLQIKLEKFKDFEAIKEEMKNLVEQEKVCNALQDEIDTLIGYEESIQELQQSVDLLRNVTRVSIPNSTACENLIPELEWLTSKEKSLSDITASYNKLKEIKKVSIPAIKELDIMVAEVEEIEELYNSLISVTAMHEKLKGVQQIKMPTELTQSIEALIKDFRSIQETEISFMGLATSARTSRDELKVLSGNLETKNAELDQFKACPLCERPFHD